MSLKLGPHVPNAARWSPSRGQTTQLTPDWPPCWELPQALPSLLPVLVHYCQKETGPGAACPQWNSREGSQSCMGCHPMSTSESLLAPEGAVQKAQVLALLGFWLWCIQPGGLFLRHASQVQEALGLHAPTLSSVLSHRGISPPGAPSQWLYNSPLLPSHLPSHPCRS